MAEHFSRFTANYYLKTQQEQLEDTSTTSAIWSIFADLNNSPLSPKLPDKHAHYRDELNTDGVKHVLACF